MAGDARLLRMRDLLRQRRHVRGLAVCRAARFQRIVKRGSCLMVPVRWSEVEIGYLLIHIAQCSYENRSYHSRLKRLAGLEYRR